MPFAFGNIEKRLDDIYEKTERDKTELRAEMQEIETALIERMERDKSELRAEMQEIKTELIERIEKTKTDLVKSFVGISIGFATLIITAMWALLTFAR